MALAHNGNLTNTDELRADLIADNAVFQTTIDSEAMAMLINKYSDGDIVRGVLRACECFKGSYALVVMTADKLIAVRDPYGIRPLCVGELMGRRGGGLRKLRARRRGRQFPPRRGAGGGAGGGQLGHAFLSYGMQKEMQERGMYFRVGVFFPPRQYSGRRQRLSDPHAGGKNSSAETIRGRGHRFGRTRFPPSSRREAIRRRRESPYVEALEKNRYVGRTFIQPDQKMQRKQRQRQNEPLEGKYSGQAAGADRRLDRAWHHVEADRAHAEKRGRERGARAHMFAREQSPHAISASICSRTAS